MADDHLSVPMPSPSGAPGRRRSSSLRSQGSRDDGQLGTPAAPAHDHIGRQDYFWQPSIRIRRLPSLSTVTEQNTQANTSSNASDHGHGLGQQSVGRRRSTSAPQRPHVSIAHDGQDHLAGVAEETTSPVTGRVTESIPQVMERSSQPQLRPNPPQSRMSRRLRRVQNTINPKQDDYEDGLVDYLDVVGMFSC